MRDVFGAHRSRQQHSPENIPTRNNVDDHGPHDREAEAVARAAPRRRREDDGRRQARRRLHSRKAQARGPARDQTGPDDSIGLCVRIARPARSVRVHGPRRGGRRVRPAVCDNKTAPALHHDRAVRRRGFVSLRRACLLYARLVLPEGLRRVLLKTQLGGARRCYCKALRREQVLPTAGLRAPVSVRRARAASIIVRARRRRGFDTVGPGAQRRRGARVPIAVTATVASTA